MTEVAERNSTLEGVSALFNHIADDSKFQTFRNEAFALLNEVGLPAVKNEEYKFTNLTKVFDKQIKVGLAGNTNAITKNEIDSAKIPNLDAYNLVFVNGQFSKEQSSNDLPKGIAIKQIVQAIEDQDANFLNSFGQITSQNTDAFLQMNTALVQDGAFITVDAKTVIDKPIALIYINDATQTGAYYNARNLIIVGKSSQIDFVEMFSSKGTEACLTNIVTEIAVEDNAHVHYYKIQNNHQNAYHVGTTQVRQTRSSVFSAYTFTLNGAMVRNNLNIAVDGEGCEAHMYGLYLVNGKTHVDNHTVVDHIKPHSYSNELYKGILEDTSKGVFNGKIFVRKEAQKTNAFQSNKNILLSDSSVVNTKPQLEIWADDVKCSHGCTTGQIDQDALFYLRARGLSKDSARAVLLYAFAIEVIEQVKLEPLKNYLEKIISTRLHNEF